MDYPHGASAHSEPTSLAITEDVCTKLISTICPKTTRMIFVEDTSPWLIVQLGGILDIDPVFFANYVNTDFKDIENSPPPPSLALLPSLISQTGHLHLHYQRLLDLGSADSFKDSTYAFKTGANVPRNVRRLTPLSGRQLALARTCCSLLTKSLGTSFICR